MYDLNRYKILNGEFDPIVHKEVFVNYLEVIIHPDGSVHYATPSHQEYLINYLCNNGKYKDRESVFSACPREYWFNCLAWLLEESSCIAVWTDDFKGCLNEFQIKALEELRSHGIYKGLIQEAIYNVRL